MRWFNRFRAIVLATLVILPLLVWSVPASADSSQTVSFAGVSVTVPASWPVLDVDGATGCVRYDRHAVYLGSPQVSNCPPGLIGHVATVQVLRQGPVPAGEPVRTLTGGLQVFGGGPVDPDLTVTAPGSPVQVRITSGPAESAAVAAIADTVVFSQAALTAPVTASAATAPTRPSQRNTTRSDATKPESTLRAPVSGPMSPAAVLQAGTFTGAGFDACTAPSVSQMNAWLASPYRAVGVYVGGANRACAQPNLTRSWVAAVHAQGWHLLPIYVGRQAPCNSFSYAIDPAQAATQGTAAANDAVRQMAALGLGAGNPVYLDIEPYDISNAGCVAAVRSFVDSWTTALHANSYASGIYGGSTSMMTNLVQWAGDHSFHNPDAIWYARWDDNAATTGDPAIPDGFWSNHQRIHQYAGDVSQSWGGVSIDIDRNQVDGPVTGTPVGLVNGNPPDALLRQPYTTTLAAAGGTAPYTYSAATGALPAGLALSPSGNITGTPTDPGPHSVRLTITDSSSPKQIVTQSVPVTVNFVDYPPTLGFYDDVMWLAAQKLSTGYSDGTFRPQNGVTRKDVAVLLYRYANPGKNPPACTKNAFTDVPKSYAFCPQISWAAGRGITTGYSDGTFRPNATATRQDIAVMLYRYANGRSQPPACTIARFNDVPRSYAFCPQIDWLAVNKITTGYPGGGFHPQTTATRKDSAVFLHRLDRVLS